VQEYGKSKIYFPVHDTAIMSKEVRFGVESASRGGSANELLFGPPTERASLCNKETVSERCFSAVWLAPLLHVHEESSWSHPSNTCLQDMAQKQAEVKQLGAEAADKQEQVNRCKQGALAPLVFQTQHLISLYGAGQPNLRPICDLDMQSFPP
jgi:hypothetical protein